MELENKRAKSLECPNRGTLVKDSMNEFCGNHGFRIWGFSDERRILLVCTSFMIVVIMNVHE